MIKAWAVKGPGGISPNLIRATRRAAVDLMLACVAQHADKEERKKAAENLSVVQVIVEEIR